MKYLLPVLLLTIFLVPVYPLYAKDKATSSARLEASENHELEINDRTASREAEFKQKLRQFHDQRKVTILERLSRNLNLLNQKRTKVLTKQLNRMSDILKRLATKANEATGSANLTQAKAAISTAQASIDAAKSAVLNQSQKSYVLNNVSESTASQEARTVRNNLRSDLKSVAILVMKAKDDLIAANKMVVLLNNK